MILSNVFIDLVSCTELIELKGNSEGEFGPCKMPKFQFNSNTVEMFKCLPILHDETTFLNIVKRRHSGENRASSEK